MAPIVRFAPSPTGFLHLGNARAAVVNWLFARKHGGQFMLRLDDTDASRSRPEYVQGVYDDLAWLGLDYDIFARQSDRAERYRECQKKLIESGRLYACYETPEELEQKRRRQLARKEPPIYDRSALRATQAEKEAWQKEGRSPYWRFRLEEGVVTWQDVIKGELSFTPAQNLSDPILVKADGTFLYTFSSVVDDLDFKISHIIRGEDHVTNTAVQIQLFDALNEGAVDITFAHLPLLLDGEGQPLSKRINSFCLQNLRASGIEPMALNCFLAGLGSSAPQVVTSDLKELASQFDLSQLHGGACVEEKALMSVQHKLLHSFPYKAAAARVPEDLEGMTETEWDVIREAIDKLDDVMAWKEVLHGTVKETGLSEEDQAYTRQAAEWLAHEQTFTETTWEQWTGALKKETGRKGFALAHPLRRALTGRDNGPEMKRLLPLIDREKVLERLRG